MGKSHIIKYHIIAKENEKERTTFYEQRIQDIIVRTGRIREGLNIGDKIRISEQMHPEKITDIVMKRKVWYEKSEQNIISHENTGLSKMNSDIQWRNQWLVPRKYYRLESVGFSF